ncbi:MAG: hypothetical protein J6Y52_04210 [Bacteroidales bacterium]|nr:hypothetical protein [Bacteroidales bacterium]
MKRLFLLGMLVVTASMASAQNCAALLEPYFGSAEKTAQFAQENPEKFAYHCCEARSAFYESDVVPEGAILRSITEVRHRITGESLPADFVVNLTTLSYYAYNFYEGFQAQHYYGNVTYCFSTPSSTHPYLVLRSIDDMKAEAMSLFENN